MKSLNIDQNVAVCENWNDMIDSLYTDGFYNLPKFLSELISENERLINFENEVDDTIHDLEDTIQDYREQLTELQAELIEARKQIEALKLNQKKPRGRKSVKGLSNNTDNTL